jgi:hypothetical protein
MTLTAIPFLIKSHHRATINAIERVRVDANGYKEVKTLYFQVMFEGPGFKKEYPEKFPTEDDAVKFVTRLGFSKYKVRSSCSGSRYIDKDMKKWYRNSDGGINWKDCYDHRARHPHG